MTYQPNIVTIDKDDLEEGQHLRKMLLLLGIKAEWRKSSSGRGYHFKIHLTEDADKETHLLMRWWIGDDFGRIAGDYRRMVMDVERFSVLFYHKNGKRCSDWKPIEEDL